ncbi:MAG: DUF3786 domain-containing protein [Nitrospirae bacterium]|nr:MAG: DUF3786 domain-containing protein [Nitrospirota bacterium]
MNTIDVYKQLPGKNCGECPQNTCMAFALAIVKGEADPSECPYVSEETRKVLSEAKGEDWREKLIGELKDALSRIDVFENARRVGATVEDGTIRIKCLGMDYTVSPEGDISTNAYINPWIKILLLHYIKTGGIGEPAEDWVSFSELKSGMVKTESFRRDCEEPLKELLDTDFEKTSRAMMMLGARETTSGVADVAWIMKPLPRVPMLILYWRRNEEDPVAGDSRVRILFDKTADRYLDVESLIFLVEGMVHLLEHFLTMGNKRG